MHRIFKCRLLGQGDVVFVYFQSKLLLKAEALGIPKNFQSSLPVPALELKNQRNKAFWHGVSWKKV